MIGNDEFPASLLDLPAVVESFKTYDDCALVKTADIGQVKSSYLIHLLLICVNFCNFGLKLNMDALIWHTDDHG
jgi:TATA-binding protein-associated factor Taf7